MGEAELQDKVALVTGAAKGVGRATAVAMAAAGAKVCLVDLNRTEGEETLQVIRNAGGEAIFVPGDVAEQSTVKESVGQCEAEFGSVSVLVNNAAIMIGGTVLELTRERWDCALAANLTAAFLYSQRVIPGMARSGGGTIINVSSVAGVVGCPGRAAYSASKAGLIGLTRAMAADHGNVGVRVNAVYPSGIETDQMRDFFNENEDPDAARRANIEMHLTGRLADPSELASFLVFLASDKASFMTGSALAFDGGYTAR